MTFQVGRTGAITPVAELKPVLLAGTTVKRASLHNANEIKKLDLHIRDIVNVEKGGEIIITTNQKEKTITITDTGHGIESKNLEHIFDLFYTTKSAGSGLGLPTAFKIVQEHNGNISIKSTVNSGTQVNILLP